MTPDEIRQRLDVLTPQREQLQEQMQKLLLQINALDAEMAPLRKALITPVKPDKPSKIKQRPKPLNPAMLKEYVLAAPGGEWSFRAVGYTSEQVKDCIRKSKRDNGGVRLFRFNEHNAWPFITLITEEEQGGLTGTSPNLPML